MGCLVYHHEYIYEKENHSSYAKSWNGGMNLTHIVEPQSRYDVSSKKTKEHPCYKKLYSLNDDGILKWDVVGPAMYRAEMMLRKRMNQRKHMMSWRVQGDCRFYASKHYSVSSPSPIIRRLRVF